MPEITIDNRFLLAATVLSYDSEEVCVTVAVCRVYQAEFQILRFPPTAEALRVSRGFLRPDEYYEDLLAFTQLVRHIPFTVPSGTRLPFHYFMNSPLAEPEYHTFSGNFKLHRIDYLPMMRIDTGFEFPFTLSASLVYETRLIYRKERLISAPENPPLGYIRQQEGIWKFDLPDESSWGFDNSSIEVFRRITNQFGDSFFVYPDCAFPWNGVVLSEEEALYSAFTQPCGIQTNSAGRVNLYGDSEENQLVFPYHSIEPIPVESPRLYVEEAAGSVMGFLKVFRSPLTTSVYPPDTKVVHASVPFPVCFVPLPIKPAPGKIPGLPSFVVRIPFEILWSGVIDGSWRISQGGIKLL